MRQFGMNDQIRGLDDDTALEFSTRIVEQDGRARIRVETKKDYKERMGRSPDLADSACVILAMLRERFGIHPGRVTGLQAQRKDADNFRKFDLDGGNTYATQPV
jgi:hypothetical protein